jgi:hypothetical protein
MRAGGPTVRRAASRPGRRRRGEWSRGSPGPRNGPGSSFRSGSGEPPVARCRATACGRGCAQGLADHRTLAPATRGRRRPGAAGGTGWTSREGTVLSAAVPSKGRRAREHARGRAVRPTRPRRAGDAPGGTQRRRGGGTDSRGQHERDDGPDEPHPGPDRARQRVHVLQRPVGIAVRPGRSDRAMAERPVRRHRSSRTPSSASCRNGEPSRPSTGWHCSIHPMPA